MSDSDEQLFQDAMNFDATRIAITDSGGTLPESMGGPKDYSQMSYSEAFGEGFNPLSKTVYSSAGREIIDVAKMIQPYEGLWPFEGKQRPFRLIPNIQETVALFSELGIDITTAAAGARSVPMAARTAMMDSSIENQMAEFATGREIASVSQAPLTPHLFANSPRFQALAQFYEDNYDTGNNGAGLKKYIATEPVAFLGDAAMVLSFLGKGLTLSGSGPGVQALRESLNANKSMKLKKRVVENVKTFARTDLGSQLELIGEAAEVSGLSARSVEFLRSNMAKAAGSGGRELLGILTGRGPVAFREWYQAKKLTPQQKRIFAREVSSIEILDKGRENLVKLRDERSRAYKDKMTEVFGDEGIEINLQSVYDELDAATREFNIKWTTDKEGRLIPDFERATVDSAGVQKVKETIDDIMNWGAVEGDFSVFSVDVLKKRLADRFSETSNSRAFTSRMYRAVRDELNRVPGYQELTSDFEKASRAIEDVDDALHLGTQRSKDAALRRMLTVLSDETGYREDMARSLGDMTGNDIIGVIAAEALKSWKPTGGVRLAAALSIAGGGTYILGGGGAGALMATLAMVPFQSPRMMANFMRFLGLPKNTIATAMDLKGGKFRDFAKTSAFGKMLRAATGVTARQIARPLGKVPELTAEDLAVQQELEQSIRNRQ